eukprot:3470189-Rhodomonas_salina.1
MVRGEEDGMAGWWGGSGVLAELLAGGGMSVLNSKVSAPALPPTSPPSPHSLFQECRLVSVEFARWRVTCALACHVRRSGVSREALTWGAALPGAARQAARASCQSRAGPRPHYHPMPGLLLPCVLTL